MKKQNTPEQVIDNLLKMRTEYARWGVDYVAKTIVAKIDICLYDEYKILSNNKDTETKL